MTLKDVGIDGEAKLLMICYKDGGNWTLRFEEKEQGRRAGSSETDALSYWRRRAEVRGQELGSSFDIS